MKTPKVILMQNMSRFFTAPSKYSTTVLPIPVSTGKKKKRQTTLIESFQKVHLSFHGNNSCYFCTYILSIYE